MTNQTWFDRPIAYHRVFVPLAGSVTGAVMLSQAMYWSNRTSDPEGWFYKTSSEWEQETGLSRHEQDSVRKKLKKTSFWREKLTGVPATIHYKIDFPALFSSLTESGKLDCHESANQFSENRQTLYTETTTETTTESSYIELDIQKPNKTIQQDESKSVRKERKKVARAKFEFSEAYTACVEHWLKEVHPGWDFGGMQGKALKSILLKMNEFAIRNNIEVSVAWLVNSFKKLCQCLPDWYKDKDLPIINSKYNEVAHQIRNGTRVSNTRAAGSEIFGKYGNLN